LSRFELFFNPVKGQFFGLWLKKGRKKAQISSNKAQKAQISQSIKVQNSILKQICSNFFI
jgi:hypothetical protein